MCKTLPDYKSFAHFIIYSETAINLKPVFLTFILLQIQQ